MRLETKQHCLPLFAGVVLLSWSFFLCYVMTIVIQISEIRCGHRIDTPSEPVIINTSGSISHTMTRSSIHFFHWQSKSAMHIAKGNCWIGFCGWLCWKIGAIFWLHMSFWAFTSQYNAYNGCLGHGTRVFVCYTLWFARYLLQRTENYSNVVMVTTVMSHD